MTATVRSAESVNKIISEYAQTSTGGIVATSSYATTLKKFSVIPASSQTYRLHRMIVYVADTGAKFTEANYGVIAGGLTNGITITTQTSTGGVMDDLTDGLPIKTVGNWRRVCYDVALSDNGVALNNAAVRWTFANSGTPVRVEGAKGEGFHVSINDSCTGLDDHTFMLQGLIENEWT